MLNDQKVVKMWLDGKSPATQNSYASAIKKLTTFADKPVREITTDDVFDFKWSLGDFAPNTVRLYLRAVQSFFRFAVSVGHMSVDPAKELKIPKVQERFDDHCLSLDEVQQVIAQATKFRDRLLIRFLYATGARVSEACSVQWTDMTVLNNGLIAVRFLGKGDKERTVSFGGKLAVDLLLMQEGLTPDDSPYVFSGNRSDRLDASTAWRIVHDAATKAGLVGVSPHWFRHSHASHALHNGASLAEVRDSLGHSSVATTDRYLHATDNSSSARYLKDV